MWLSEIGTLIDMTDGDVAFLARVHDPQAGELRGGAFSDYARNSRAWFAVNNAKVRHVATIQAPPRIVSEYLVEWSDATGAHDLPVAVVVDRGRDALDVRIYHSTWPLTGSHAVRAPLVEPDVRAHASDVVGEYFDALAAGDADRVVATYEHDGYFREPSGSQYVHRGADVLLPFYRYFFSAGGGIPLKHCTVSEDGTRSALEYVCNRWGAHDLPPQAGVAVYTRGSSGRIASAHVYDDVAGPLD